MHLVIDFDYTLFNTEAMRRACMKALSGFGVTEQQYRAAEKELKAKKLYDIERHLDMLVTGQARALVGQAVDGILSHSDEFLYPDSTAFLQRHSQHTLTLLSFGSPAWQERKIAGAHLTNLVDHCIVTNQPKADMLNQWVDESELVFLNDRGSELAAMKDIRSDIITVWVKRPATPYATEPCATADVTVTDLSFSIEDILHTLL